MTTDAIRAATAERKVRLFIAEQSEEMVRLACMAALPVALDPDLLHLIRLNFFYGLPFTAESVFLLSKLCVEIGDGLFEIPPETRSLLLRRLFESQPEARVRQMAALLWDYSAGGAWPGNEQLARAQQLTALNLLAPEKAQAWLEAAEAARRGSLPATGAREWFVAMRAEVRFQTDIAASAKAPPPEAATPILTSRQRLVALYEFLVTYFSSVELMDLAFVLGIDYEHLSGDFKSGKARELVMYLERRERLDELETELRRVRPLAYDNIIGPAAQVPPSEDAPPAPEMTAERRAAVLDVLISAYNPEELDILAFYLGISHEDLAGSTHQGRALDLARHLEREGRLGELYAQVRRERPGLLEDKPPATGKLSAEDRRQLSSILASTAWAASPESRRRFLENALGDMVDAIILEGSPANFIEDATFFLESYGSLNRDETALGLFLKHARDETDLAPDDRDFIDGVIRRYKLASSPGETTAKGDLFLSVEERQKLVSIIANDYEMQMGPASRFALLDKAGLRRFVPFFDLNGSPRVLAAGLVDLLEPFGLLPERPIYHALGALLNYIMQEPDTPLDFTRYLAEITVKYRLIIDEAYLDELRKRYGLADAGVEIAYQKGDLRQLMPPLKSGNQLSSADLERLVFVLANLYEFLSLDGRQAVLSVSGIDEFVRVDVDLNGTPFDVAAKVIDKLLEHGRTPQGDSALSRLLAYLTADVALPLDDRDFINDLIRRYDLAPSPDEAVAKGGRFLSVEERQKLVSILANSYDIQMGPASRSALLHTTGLGRFVPFFNLQGAPRVLAAGLVDLLEPFGLLPENPSYHALGVLLDNFRGFPDTPTDDARYLAEIIVKYRLVNDEAHLNELRKQYGLTVIDVKITYPNGDLRQLTSPLKSGDQLSNTDLERLVFYLANLYEFLSVNERLAVLERSGIGEFVRVDVDLNGTPFDVAARVIDKLLEYGRTPQGDSALGRLLAYLRTDETVPPEHRDFIDEIVARYGLLGGDVSSGEAALRDFRTMLDEARAIFEDFIRQRERFIKLVQQNHPGELQATGTYDDAFRRMYDLFNEEEMEAFRALRDITKVRTHRTNSRIRDWAESHDVRAMFPNESPEVQTLERELVNLRVHLARWFAAYDETFLPDPRRAIVSPGDEKSGYAVWPAGLERAVDALLGRSDDA